MELKIRIQYTPNLMSQLESDGFKVKKVGNTLIIDLRDEGDYFFIPFNLPEHVLIFELTEYGGASTNTGGSQIVTDIFGKPLKPFVTYTSGHLSNSDHARFSVPNVVVTVKVDRWRDDVDLTIIKHIAQEYSGTAWIDTEVIYKGKLEDFPINNSVYADAVNAAVDKSNCYHCRTPFFIEK